jgi:hypothetical protein
MYGSCKHRSIRALAPTVLWCPECGAHRRQVDGRWLRWSPAGVTRSVPLRSASEREAQQRQLALDLSRPPLAIEFTAGGVKLSSEPRELAMYRELCEQFEVDNERLLRLTSTDQRRAATSGNAPTLDHTAKVIPIDPSRRH